MERAIHRLPQFERPRSFRFVKAVEGLRPIIPGWTPAIWISTTFFPDTAPLAELAHLRRSRYLPFTLVLADSIRIRTSGG